MALSATQAKLLERSIEAADAASACIMKHYGKDLEIWDKGIGSHTGDCVTQADHDAQDIIFEKLFRGKLHTDPFLEDTAVLAEEMPNHEDSERFEKPYCFVIDPLDGTRGFLDHNNSFATSIGYIKQDGTPVFGVVELPGFRRRYVGVHNERAEENDQPIVIPELGKDLILLVSEAEIFAAEKNKVWHHICERIIAETSVEKIRPQVIGSPVHKGCYTVAGGVPALYLGLPRAKKGVSLWDLAGIAPIVTGAGGFVSDCYGEPLELNRKESIYAHHKGFLFCSHEVVAKATLKALSELDNIVF